MRERKRERDRKREIDRERENEREITAHVPLSLIRAPNGGLIRFGGAAFKLSLGSGRSAGRLQCKKVAIEGIIEGHHLHDQQ